MNENCSEFKSGFVTIIGRSNVGKSTLLNSFLGTKLSIVTETPQTTRNRIQGIKHLDTGQIVFVDTPGIHKPRHLMNKKMVNTSRSALRATDIVLVMLDVSQEFGSGDKFVISLKDNVENPVFLVLNKVDLIEKKKLLPMIDKYSKEYDFDEIVPVSALEGTNVEELESLVVSRLPEGPEYFPEDIISDRPEEFFVRELIREKVIKHLREELPYTTAVRLEIFDERDGDIVIEGFIFVEEKSQKAIVIGKGGSMIKKISIEARRALEVFLNRKVHLNLHVKLQEDWREREDFLKTLGLTGED